MNSLMLPRQRLIQSLHNVLLGLLWVGLVLIGCLIIAVVARQAKAQALPPVLPSPIYAPTIAPTTTLPPSITLPPIGR